MKKFLGLAFITVLFYQAQAQLSKGDLTLGGSMNFSVTRENFEPGSGLNSFWSSSMGFSPRAGFVISDRSVLGLSVSYYQYGYVYRYTTYFDEYQQREFAIGPYFRQHFSRGEHLAFFLHGTAQFKIGRITNVGDIDSRGDIRSIEGITIFISPGINYFLDEQFSLEATFGYLYFSSLDSERIGINPFRSNSATSTFGVHLNFSSFTFGVQYFIKRQKRNPPD